MTDGEAWRLEEQLWLEGPEVYHALLDRECIMVFPGAGMMRADEIMRSVRGAPRWVSVVMTNRVVARPDAGTIILGYRAEGRRAGSPRYTVYCTSTYRLAGESWTIVQHQQTPVG